MKTFDPNDHSTISVFYVFIKRLGKEFIVNDIRLLGPQAHKPERIHLWGFVKIGDETHEWDTTWGDVLRQEVLA